MPYKKIKSKIHLLTMIVTALTVSGFPINTIAETDNQKLLRIIEEEKSLVFDKFDHQTALDLGLKMVDYVKKKNLSQTVFDIRRNDQILFRVALAGSSVDNEHWVRRKNLIVNRFQVSSMRKKLEFNLLKGEKWLDDYPNGDGSAVKFWGLSHDEAVGLVGGGFPINVKNVGFVGTITSSGGSDESDHDLVVKILKSYLKK